VDATSPLDATNSLDATNPTDTTSSNKQYDAQYTSAFKLEEWYKRVHE